MRVSNSQDGEYRMNYYEATIIVRLNDKGLFLYDVVNIKKEARKPTDH